jgi:hypothetical protein
MLAVHEHVFDETITGSATTWYTADQHNGTSTESGVHERRV